MKHAIRYHACRLFGHAWAAIPSDWRPRIGVPLSVRCERCEMERHDAVDRVTGSVLKRSYRRPADYLYATKDDRPSRAEFRSAWIERSIREVRKANRQQRKAA